jgi:hypothetical protein
VVPKGLSLKNKLSGFDPESKPSVRAIQLGVHLIPEYADC